MNKSMGAWPSDWIIVVTTMLAIAVPSSSLASPVRWEEADGGNGYCYEAVLVLDESNQPKQISYGDANA